MGETLEAAAVREVLEESGVHIQASSVRYHSSQPWPFPQSLMVGFMSEAIPICTPGVGLEALSQQAQRAAREVGLLPQEAQRYAVHALPAVKVDPAELEDARWFHRSWLTSALGRSGAEKPLSEAQRTFRIPGRYALANSIISDWLAEAEPQQAWPGDAVPDVSIDCGTFKYVLLRLSSTDGARSKLIVRGDGRAAYHNHVFAAARAEVGKIDPGLTLETVGGGRMEHLEDQKVVSVYGYSAAFGQAPHDVTAGVLRREMPFHDIVVSYEGY